MPNRFFLDPLGGWVTFVLVTVALVALAVWAYVTTPAPMSRGRRTILWVTRALAFVLLLVGISRPIALVADSSREEPEVVLLVDRSASMGLPASRDSLHGASRATAATRVVEALHAPLSERFRVTVREFDRLLAAPASYDGTVQPDSFSVSAPGDAVESLLRESGGGALAGVVLVTDGAANAGRDLVTVADRLATPLFAVAVGDSIAPDDVQVTGVTTPATAFLGEPVTVTAKLRGTGAPVVVDVTLLDASGDELDRARVALAGSGATTEQPFRLTPSAVGTQFYRVSFATTDLSPSGNALALNDVASFALDVRRDRVGVLMLAEHLGWDFTFLRRTLERDTTMAYTFLVKPGGDRLEPSGARAVRRFPSTLEELRAFECVVLGDVGREFLSARDLENLAAFVEGGGGLLLVGGDRSGGLGRFQGTPLARVIPLGLDARGGPSSRALSSPVLTALGEASPLVAMHGDLVENRKLWADLPPITSSPGIGAARPGAQVLVELRRGAEASPLVTTGRAGSGRVLVFSGQGVWKWKFVREGLGTDDAFFERFWVGVMRWLSDPEPSERVTLEPNRKVFRVGDDVILTGRVLGKSLEPLRGAEVQLVVRSERSARELAPEWGASGSVTFRAGSLPPGRYDYELTVEEPSAPTVSKKGTFLVELNGPEWWNLGARPDFLRQATMRAHGIAVPVEQVGELPDRISAPALATVRPVEVALWNEPLALVAFLLLLAIEWWLRRRVGLA